MEQDIQDIEVNSTGDELPPVLEQINLTPCPLLGLIDDHISVLSFPSNGNRCYASWDAEFVDHEKQREICLSDRFLECPTFQQVISAQAEDDHASAGVKFFGRILNIRTFTVTAMTILILLAALIWWPSPGSRIQDKTVFSASFEQKSPGAEIQVEEPIIWSDSSQAGRTGEESISAASSSEASRPNDISLDSEHDVVDRSRAVKEPDSLAKEEQSAAKNEADSEISEKLARIVAGDRSSEEVFADKSASENEAEIQVAISDLPDLHQMFQDQQAAAENFAEPVSSFSPVSYSGQSVQIPLILAGANDNESLPVYQAPVAGNDQFIELSRYEPVNILGRTGNGEWLKVWTESGIEGWVLTADTALGDWIEPVPEIENDSESGKAHSAPTSLPMADEAVVNANGLILRSAPGVTFKRIAFATNGEAVSLLGRWQDGPWVRIRLDGGAEGWVKVDALAPAK